MKEQMGFNFQRELECIRERYGFDYAAIALVQPAERRFELKWTYVAGNLSDRHRRITLQSGKGIAGLVFKTGKAMFVSDVKELGLENLYQYPITVAEKLVCFGAIPLFKYNRVGGVLLIGSRKANGVSANLFGRFQQEFGPEFGPFYSKEMVKE